mgnify:CR=1 FL=1
MENFGSLSPATGAVAGLCGFRRVTTVWHAGDSQVAPRPSAQGSGGDAGSAASAVYAVPGRLHCGRSDAGERVQLETHGGELWERKSNYNLWSEKLPDGGYNQSYQIGFYEYFCLCEDLGMMPLPTLSAGMNCQIRVRQYKLKENTMIPSGLPGV